MAAHYELEPDGVGPLHSPHSASSASKRGVRLPGRCVQTAHAKAAIAIPNAQPKYHDRARSVELAPGEVSLTLAGDTPAERVAPANVWAYGW